MRIPKNNASFTVWLKVDYYDQPEEDKILERNPKDSQPGSFWQYSVGEVKDSEGRILNKQSALQIDHLVKDGGLRGLLKDLVNRLPKFLDENGLKSV